MGKQVAWSHSALNMYENCPYKYAQIKFYKKIKDVYGAEAKEGNIIHERLENRLLKKVPLTGMDARYETLCKIIEQAPGELHPECKFTLTRGMKKTTFFAKNAWFRGIIDVLKVNGDKAWIGDWKTGKVKNEYDQLELFAGIVFIYYPEVKEIKANYIWLKSMEFSPTQSYTRESLHQIWSKHLPRALALEQAANEENWPTKVSGLCKSYCIVNELGKCPDPEVPVHCPKTTYKR